MNTSTSMAEKEMLLRSLPHFAALNGKEYARLARQGRIVTLQKDEVLFHEGDKSQGLYVVISGIFKVSRNSHDGKEIVLHLIRPDHLLGEVAVFKRGDPIFPATATAAEESSVLFLPAGIVLDLVRGNAELAMNLLSALATRLYMFTRKLEAHNMREAPQRLAAYLLHRHRLRGKEDTVCLDVSRETLASMLGTARETISRTLSQLAQRGTINVQGRNISLLNKELLQLIADGQD